jgi:hypothetical protein
MDGVLALLMWKRWPHRVLALRTDTSLQLLRLVNENKRIGTWKQGLHEIPVTEKEETLGVVEVVEGRIGIARVSSRISTSDLRPADDLAQGRWSRIVADLVLMCCSDFWLRGTDCVYLLFLYFAVRHPLDIYNCRAYLPARRDIYDRIITLARSSASCTVVPRLGCRDNWLACCAAIPIETAQAPFLSSLPATSQLSRPPNHSSQTCPPCIPRRPRRVDDSSRCSPNSLPQISLLRPRSTQKASLKPLSQREMLLRRQNPRAPWSISTSPSIRVRSVWRFATGDVRLAKRP